MLVLIIDDEDLLATTMRRALEREGFSIALAASGAQGLKQASELRPGAVIVDMRLPDIPGLDVCRQLRETSDSIIVAISAYAEAPLQDAGREQLVDLYLSKPVSPREFVSRIRALKRLRQPREPESTEYHDGFLYVDLLDRTVRKGCKRIYLSDKEFEVLTLLLRQRNRVVPREELFQRIWPEAPSNADKFLSQYVRRVRTKIEADPSAPKYIRTKRGVGYWFSSENGADPLAHSAADSAPSGSPAD